MLEAAAYHPADVQETYLTAQYQSAEASDLWLNSPKYIDSLVDIGKGTTAELSNEYRRGTNTSSEIGRVRLPESYAVAVEAVDAIHEIRRLTELTFEQLADIMCVSRRSVHSWVAGGNIRPSKRDKLGKVLATIRYVDSGNAGDNNNRLLHNSFPGGLTGIAMLRDECFEDLKSLLGPGIGHSAPIPHIDRDRTPVLGGMPSNWYEIAQNISDQAQESEGRILTGGINKRISLLKR
ncbi:MULTISPECIES: hypothetical protein [unclassified Roseibium]|uniref:hypothetical protein n=1 Tax=unclassified Roseibium TaxID=2629323 RepID=UPI00273FD840|nr:MULTISPECIES: hypothetical protein [unclassified Roseibium]